MISCMMHIKTCNSKCVVANAQVDGKQAIMNSVDSFHVLSMACVNKNGSARASMMTKIQNEAMVTFNFEIICWSSRLTEEYHIPMDGIKFTCQLQESLICGKTSIFRKKCKIKKL